MPEQQVARATEHTHALEFCASARVPSLTELRLLPEAIRFGVAFIGAIHTVQALRGQRGPGIRPVPRR